MGSHDFVEINISEDRLNVYFSLQCDDRGGQSISLGKKLCKCLATKIGSQSLWWHSALVQMNAETRYLFESRAISPCAYHTCTKVNAHDFPSRHTSRHCCRYLCIVHWQNVCMVASMIAQLKSFSTFCGWRPFFLYMYIKSRDRQVNQWWIVRVLWSEESISATATIVSEVDWTGQQSA